MRTVVVVPYDNQWPALFAAESEMLKALLNGAVIGFHHIGSTSVPGLAAKPIIDILLEVTDINALDTCSPALSRAGYLARGESGIAGRRYFTKGGDQRSHHLHAFSAGDKEVLRHLVFRDYLRENRRVADDYAELKQAAASLCRNDSQRYSALKTDFIEHHLRMALRDMNSQS
ncbi:GrpB family protein [Pantoea vagans]|nr:GrpB family protein [Pantoea vagans]